MNEKIRQELSEVVGPLIGHTISVEHIHTDRVGWDYYIPEKSLKANHPLILRHYRGPLFMVIPFEDWEELEERYISVQEYVKDSIWSFGYFWGGGSLLNGIHWQPFEEKGITETEKIFRYLKILSCRTAKRVSGLKPTNQKCESCPVQNCPFSPSSEASWDNEIQEVDDRKVLYSFIQKRIQEQFGFEVVSCGSLNDGNCIRLWPSVKKDMVEVYLPERLLINLMYNPGKYNIEEIAKNFFIQLGVKQRIEAKEGRRFRSRYIRVSPDANAQFCYDYWKNDETCTWFNPNCENGIINNPPHKLSLIERLKKRFKF